MKKLYYYVQKCPKCGSRVTGRYIKKQRTKNDNIYMERESLSHGELIRFASEVPHKNCYCEDCNFEWHYDVTAKFISKERVDEEIEVRGILKRCRQFNEDNPQKGKSIFGRIFGFLP